MKAKILIALLLCFLFLNFLIIPAYATTIFEHGFEGGDFGTDPETGDAWDSTSGSPTVTSGDAYQGTYKVVIDANEYCRKGFSSQSIVHARAYINIQNLLSTGWDSFWRLNIPGTATLAAVGVNSNGQVTLYYRDAGSYHTVYSSTTMSINTWHCLELKIKCSSSDGQTDGEYRVWLDGNELTDIAQTNVDTDYTYVNNIDFGKLGWSAGSMTFWGDCVVVADTYIGPIEEGPTEYTFTFTAQCNCSANPNVWRELSKLNMETASCTATSHAWREYLKVFSETVQPSSQTFKWKEWLFTFAETAFPSANFTKQIEYAIAFYEFVFTQIVNPNANLNYWREIYKTFIDTANPSANMTKQAELKVTLAEFIETIIGKAVLYPLLPTPPPEEINWGIIALAFSIIAFTVGITALTAKRD